MFTYLNLGQNELDGLNFMATICQTNINSLKDYSDYFKSPPKKYIKQKQNLKWRLLN